MKSFIYFILTLFVLSCSTNQNKLEVYDFQGIEKFLHQKNNKTYVINFWATWCAPCIKELPYFEQIQEKYKKDVEVILISLDFPSQYETKLIPFLEKRQLKSKVIVLDDVDMNSWIPKIDLNWGGAIPVTLIYNSNKRQFYPQPFTYDELAIEVEKFLN
jgi:thiol-disulfide isomerase/thioredoxin